MNSLNTLYFPGTALYSIRQYPLFLLFPKIHLIKPVEEDPADSSKESTDSFIKSGFCQEHTPCPLGENRKRFVRLIADISSRKDDYAAQLSSLILASRTAVSSGDDDSERAIISSLQHPDELQKKKLQTGAEEKLWQARLVLAIGEILDREEEEIARNLATVDDEQAALFQQLHGDSDALEEDEMEDSPFAELNQVERHLSAAHSGNIRKRFNGWKTLFLASEMQGCEIFLTTSQDGGDLMLEAYEKKTGATATLLAGLELPGLIGFTGEEACQAVVAFREKNKALAVQIEELFARLVHTKEFDAASTALQSLTESWNKALETVFPARRFGRIPVTCYLLPEMSCSSLIGGATNGEANNGLLIVVG